MFHACSEYLVYIAIYLIYVIETKFFTYVTVCRYHYGMFMCDTYIKEKREKSLGWEFEEDKLCTRFF